MCLEAAACTEETLAAHLWGLCWKSARERWSKKWFLVQFSVLGGSERIAEGLGLPGFGFECLKRF